MKDGLNMESTRNIYTDELIRENARLTVRHEADRMVIEELTDKVSLLETAEREAQEAVLIKKELDATRAMLAHAVEDLRYVMAGGSACDVCDVKCTFGDACRPKWNGEAGDKA